MHNTLQLIELADTLTADRATEALRHRAAIERDGPHRRVRSRIGRRVIAIGERIAYGATQTVAR